MNTKKYIYSLIVILLAVTSCRKDDNPKLPDLSRVPQPLVVKDASFDVAISALDPESFNASFSVGLHFPEDTPPQKFDVVVMKNENKANVKVLKADVTTFPSTISLTGAQLEELFGGEVVLGDKFDVGVDITTQDGKKFEAFPAVGAGYGSGVSSQPGASVFVRYEAVCQFVIEEYVGTFEVMVDDWNDFGVGSTVEITSRGTDELIFSYPIEDAEPVVVKVNTGTNTVSVARQIIGNYGPPPGWPYGDLFAETTGGGTINYVSPCDLTLTLNINYTVGAGGFGAFPLVLKKVN